MPDILDEICEWFPGTTPEQIAAQLAKVDPATIKLHKLSDLSDEAENRRVARVGPRESEATSERT